MSGEEHGRRGPDEEFEPAEEFARRLDAQDPINALRARFRHPTRSDGTPVAYFCGNSLGLQPAEAPGLVERELEDWARLAVDAHFEARTPWYSYHEVFRDSGARLVGARPGEVVMMNGLTVNLQLMLVSFYRPTATRHKILIEDCAFPSDLYAVQSQLRFHDYDPREAMIVARPRDGEAALRTEDLEELLERRGSEIAVLLFGGVNYFTGQLFDIGRISAAAARQGCVVGWDLAHAAGNVPLRLHDWGVDFAVWCSYKYLNAGPGSVAGCFVHSRHAESVGLPRFAGWWGNDPDRRFRMHLERDFAPFPGAEGWQLSNPPILAMAPLRASLDIFEQAGIERLRAKSLRLTAYLQWWIERIDDPRIVSLTPREPHGRGCQISLRVAQRSRELFEVLHSRGVVGDYRQPDVLRFAPVPLYNTFHEVWRLGREIAQWSEQN
jgi:kynureninase